MPDPTVFTSEIKTIAQEIILKGLPDYYGDYYFSMEFLSAASAKDSNIVVPTVSSKVTINVSENGVYWSSILDGTNIDVTTQDFNRPSASGIVREVKGIPITITGATHWRLLVKGV